MGKKKKEKRRQSRWGNLCYQDEDICSVRVCLGTEGGRNKAEVEYRQDGMRGSEVGCGQGSAGGWVGKESGQGY